MAARSSTRNLPGAEVLAMAPPQRHWLPPHQRQRQPQCPQPPTRPRPRRSCRDPLPSRWRSQRQPCRSSPDSAPFPRGSSRRSGPELRNQGVLSRPRKPPPGPLLRTLRLLQLLPRPQPLTWWRQQHLPRVSQCRPQRPLRRRLPNSQHLPHVSQRRPQRPLHRRPPNSQRRRPPRAKRARSMEPWLRGASACSRCCSGQPRSWPETRSC
mmetsp:Transcript_38855/g.121396  ORF Transcript_38855/g.121396 Transcript_38855/m.121396 type:complete len:210 (+) Transcript_38855:723-1352(+)